MGWQTEVVAQLLAGNSIINSLGLFVYSGTPGVGDLIFSVAPASTTADNFGNAVLGGGSTTYSATQTAQQTSGQLTFNAVPAGTAGGVIAASGTGIILINSGLATGGDTSAQLSVSSAASAGVPTIEILGSVTITGTLTIGGSSNTGTTGLPDGTIHGTSGGASAGTAHTHTPGSFAVGNGMHNHTL